MAAGTRCGTREDLRCWAGLAGADEPVLDDDDDEVEDDPDEGDRQERREHQRDVEQRPAGEVDEDGQALAGAGPLADDRADDGERDADPQAAEDVRQRGRDLERGQDLARGRAQAAPELDAAAGRPSGCRPSSRSRPGRRRSARRSTTLLSSPDPNHRTNSGARTRIGIAWAATRYGDASRSNRTLRASP